MRRGMWCLVFAGMWVAALAAVLASTGLAGSYTVNSCSPLSSSSPWGEVNTFSVGLTNGNLCGGSAAGPIGGGDQGALYAQDNTGNAGTHIAGGAEAGWEFTAPAGTVISGVSYYRDLESKTDNLLAGLFQGDGTGIETCQGTLANDYMCSVPNNQVPASFSGLATSALFFGVQCQLQGSEEYCLSGSGSDHLATADMYSVSVTLSETASPSLSSETGTLWSGGLIAGVQQLRFDASDPSGIAQASISDAATVAAGSQEPCSYTQAVPCPQLQPGVVNLNTATLPDGPAQLTLTVTDAAGNATSATSPALIIDNNGPPAPVGLAANAVGGGSKVVDLRWSNPPSSPAPVTAAYAELCQASCGTPVSVSPSGSATITVPAPGTYVIKVWLVDGTGKGGIQNAASATVSVPPGPGETPGDKKGTGAPQLRLKAQLRHKRLKVSIVMPMGERGAVKILLGRRQGGHVHVLKRHTVKPRHGIARTVFVLAKRVRRASAVILIASADGTKSGRLEVRLHRLRRAAADILLPHL